MLGMMMKYDFVRALKKIQISMRAKCNEDRWGREGCCRFETCHFLPFYLAVAKLL